MQPLDRDGLSADAVRALLTADSLEVSSGLDLLDNTGAFVADISDDFDGGSVSRDCYATVHGDCRLKITRELAWGKDRVRPWMELSRVTGYEDVTRVERHEVVAENLITNPSIEVDLTGYSDNGVTPTRSTAWAVSEAASLEQASTGATTDSFSSIGGDTGALRLGMQAERTYTVSATINTPTALTAPHPDRRQRIVVFTRVGTAPYVSTASAPGPVTGTARLSVTFTVPAGATEGFIRLYNGSGTTGEIVRWDAMLLEEADAPADYFDGDTPDTPDYEYVWTGTPHASTSTKRRITTTVTREPIVDRVRFNLGVYVLTTPTTKRGEDPITYDVTGYDVLHLLQDGPADTYEVTSGTTYLQAIRDVVTASGIGAKVLLDGARATTALPATRVWAMNGSGPTWLDIVNDLLREIGYDPIWADWDGALRSGPFADPAVRPVDWTFDTSDTATNIVGEDRTETQDVWSAPNWWKFVRSRMVDASGNSVQPVDGDGIYFPAVNADPAHPENTLLGRIVRKVVFLDAADQATLKAQGDKIVSQDLQVSHTWDLQIDPLPALWHRDVVTLIDAGTSNKVPVDGWTLNLDGSPGALNLGLAKDAAPDPVDSQVQATITQASPLRAVVDGATTDSFVNALDAATYAVGQRVTVTLRNPLPPLIQGSES